MKTRFFFIFLFLILFSSFTSATLNLYDDCVGAYETTLWTKTGTFTAVGDYYSMDDEPNYINSTKTNVSEIQADIYAQLDAGDGGWNALCITDEISKANTDCSTVTGGYTLIGQAHTGFQDWILYRGGYNDVQLDATNDNSCVLGNWYRVRMKIYNISTNQYISVWINDSLIFNVTDNNKIQNNDMTMGWSVQQGGGDDITGFIKNVYINEETPPPPSASSINISIPKPATETQFNILTLNINASVNSTNDFNCSLFHNATGSYHLNQTKEYSSGTNVNIDFDLNFNSDYERLFKYNIFCYNVNDNETEGNFTIYVDNQDPTFQTNLEGNNSQFTTTLDLDFNISDNKIYSILFNDTCGNNYSNESVTGNMFNFSESLDISACSVGNHTINFTICDGTFNALNCINKLYIYEKVPSLILTALDNQTGNIIDVFGIEVEWDSGTIEYNTTGGNITIPIIETGNKDIIITAIGYAQETINYDFENINPTYYFNVSLMEAGAIRIRTYKENDGTALNNVSLSIVNQDGSLDIINTTGADNEFYFTTNETGNLTIQIWKDGYTKKYYYENLITNGYVNMEAFLLTEANSQLVTFQVYDNLNQLVNNAQLSFYKTIDGELKRVAMRKTDYTGTAQVYLDNNALYILRVTHANYLQKEVSFIPTDTTYRIELTGTALTYVSIFDDIDYYYSPEKSQLYGNSNQTFIFSISSANNNLEYWGFILNYSISHINITDNSTYWTHHGYIRNDTTSTGGLVYVNMTIPNNNTFINVTYFFKKTEYDLWTKNVVYYVYPQTYYNYSAVNVFETYGNEIGEFYRILIATFFTLGLVGMTALKLSYNPVLLSLEILIVYGFFAYVNWIPLWLYLITFTPIIILFFLNRGGDS